MKYHNYILIASLQTPERTQYAGYRERPLLSRNDMNAGERIPFHKRDQGRMSPYKGTRTIRRDFHENSFLKDVTGQIFTIDGRLIGKITREGFCAYEAE